MSMEGVAAVPGSDVPTGLEAAVKLFCDVDAAATQRSQALDHLFVCIRNNDNATIGVILDRFLGTYIRSTHGKVRSRATLLLTELLESCDTVTLGLHSQPQRTRDLLVVLAQQMGCFDSLQYALRAILCLLQKCGDANAEAAGASGVVGGSPRPDSPSSTSFHIPPDVAPRLLSLFFDSVEVQSLVQSLRQQCFLLLHHLFNPRFGYLAAIRASDLAPRLAAFVRDAVRGEKDPRCLMVSLSVVEMVVAGLGPVVLGGASGASLLHEAVSCYFPITFRPPPDDPHGITHEGLVSALRRALTASPAMTKLTWPLLVEKVVPRNNEAEARADAFETIAFIARKYGDVHGHDGERSGGKGKGAGGGSGGGGGGGSTLR